MPSQAGVQSPARRAAGDGAAAAAGKSLIESIGA